ncbi:MAG: molecular chaperone TorD [Hyphomicrobiales bacterium]|nr:MAG: molecular chaperone TorD [Hyphomicrobiales bacterium]
MEEERHIAEEDRLRAHLYALIARALAAAPDQDFLDILSRLHRDETPLGQAFGALAAAARDLTAADAEEEYTRLFYGMGQGGEVLPYASYYLTGNLNDRPLVRLRADMERLGVVHSGQNGEPEDHIAYLMEMMHGLILGTLTDEPLDLDTQLAFFTAHIAPWAGEFFNDLKAANSARLYAAVAELGKAFLAIEGDAFTMAA